jgi:hypothetical protein
MATYQEVTASMILDAPLVNKHKEFLISSIRNGMTTDDIISFLDKQTTPDGILNAVIIVAYLKHARVSI